MRRPSRCRGAATRSTCRCSPCASPRRWRTSSACRSCHHKGGRPRGPEFELKPQPAPDVQITDDADAATLTSGRLTVRVAKGPDWRVEFLDGDARDHVERLARHGDDGRAGRPLHGRAALARRRRVRLRPGRALHAVRQERPGRGSVERGRRHRLRAGVQEHPLLPDQPRLRRLRQPSRKGVATRSRPRRSSACSSACPASSSTTS